MWWKHTSSQWWHNSWHVVYNISVLTTELWRHNSNKTDSKKTPGQSSCVIISLWIKYRNKHTRISVKQKCLTLGMKLQMLWAEIGLVHKLDESMWSDLSICRDFRDYTNLLGVPCLFVAPASTYRHCLMGSPRQQHNKYVYYTRVIYGTS